MLMQEGSVRLSQLQAIVREKEVRLSGMMILVGVYEESRSMTWLAELLGRSTAAITGLVDSLEEKGMVARQPLDSDRRKLMVTITDAGAEWVRGATDVQWLENQEVLRRQVFVHRSGAIVRVVACSFIDGAYWYFEEADENGDCGCRVFGDELASVRLCTQADWEKVFSRDGCCSFEEMCEANFEKSSLGSLADETVNPYRSLERAVAEQKEVAA